MIINILSVCGLVLCAVLVSKVLEHYSKEYVILITLCASMVILLYLSSYIASVLEFLRILLEASNSSDIYEVLLKSLGICVVTNLTVDVCKDSNQNALSGVALLVGKVAILLLSIPLLKELFNLVTQLIG